MKLQELNAQFLKLETSTSWRIVERLEEADGIIHLCHVCWKQNNGPVGTHSMIHWFRGKVADDVSPGPGRWTPSGTGLHDLTFVPGDPPEAFSVLQTGHCHFYIRDGEIVEA